MGPPIPGEMLASNAPAPQPVATAAPVQDAPPPPTQGGSAHSVRVLAPGEVAPAQADGIMPGQAGSLGELRHQRAVEAGETRNAEKGFEDAARLQIKAQDAQSAVERSEADQKAIAFSEERARQAKLDADNQASQARYSDVMAQKDAAYNKAIADQDSFVFDPDQYVNRMSVASKIFTVIAIGLSGLGNSRSIGGSGENIALKGLNDSIQANVDAQKEQYKRLGARAERANNAYARAREMKLDDYQASLAAKQASIAQHDMAIKTITARYDPERIDANRQMMQAHIEQESAKTKAEFTQRSHTEAEQARSNELQLRQANWNMALGAANYNLAAQSEADRHQDRLAEMAMKQQVAEQKAAGKAPGSIMGWNGVAPTQEQQNKAAEAVANYETLVPLMQKMSDFRKEHPGGETLARGPVAESKSMHKTVLTEVKNLAGLGVLTGSDVEIVTEMIGPPPDSHGISDEAYQATIQQALKYVEKKTQAKMRAYGYTPTRDANPLTRKADPMTADTGFREAEGGR